MRSIQASQITKEKIELWAKIAIAVLAIFLVAPIIFELVKGILGVAAAVLIAGILIAVAPAVSLAIANLGVFLLKFEATRNPVETLQNEYKEKAKLLESRKDAIELGMAKLKTFEGKVLTLKTKYPEEAPQFEAQLKLMRELLEIRKDRYKTAARGLKDFQDVVEKADAIWQVTQALKDISVGHDQTDEFYSELRTKTALESVQESLAHSFSELDSSMMEEDIEKEYLDGAENPLLNGRDKQ